MKKLLFVLLSVVLAGVVSAQNDRATFGLKGDVKKVTVSHNFNYRNYPFSNDWDNWNLEFSKTGRLIKVEGNMVNVERVEDSTGPSVSEFFIYELRDGSSVKCYLSRDEQNRISQMDYHFKNKLFVVSFIYDNRGRIETEKYILKSDKLDNTGYQTQNRGSLKYYYDDENNVIKMIYFDPSKKEERSVKYTYDQFDQQGNWIKRYAGFDIWEGIMSYVEMRTIEY